MTNDAMNTYTYNAENRIKTGAGATYSYDGAGLRVKKVAGSTTTRYIFSGTKVVAEYVGTTPMPWSPTREYIYSGSALLAAIEGGTTTYHHQDHLSVRVNTNTSGSVVGQQGHYLFGQSWYAASTTTKWQFTSYERDAESTLDYALFRYDNSRLGRFMTTDPVAGSVTNPQSLNRYSYVMNDPVNLVDPLGLYLRDVWCYEHGAVVGAGERSVYTRAETCFWDFRMLYPLDPAPIDRPHPGGGADPVEPSEKVCEGKARVLGGNPKTIGEEGGFDTPTTDIRVKKNSAAVIPAQWGGKSALLPGLDEISGVIRSPDGDVPFTGVSDVIGSSVVENVRDLLRSKNPGMLILELVSGKDMGTVNVTITVPRDLPCPEGTTEKK